MIVLFTASKHMESKASNNSKNSNSLPIKCFHRLTVVSGLSQSFLCASNRANFVNHFDASKFSSVVRHTEEFGVIPFKFLNDLSLIQSGPLSHTFSSENH